MRTRVPAPSARRLRRLALPLLAASALGLAAPARAVLLEYWDFDNDVATFSSSLGILYNSASAAANDKGNGEKYDTSSKTISSNYGGTKSIGLLGGSIDMSGVTVGTNGGGTPYANGAGNAPAGSALAWGLYNDAGLGHAPAGDTLAHTGSLIVFGNNSIASDVVVFSLSSVGYAGLTLSLDARNGTSGAFPAVTWSYNANDGTGWHDFTLSLASGSASVGTWGGYTADLSSIAALDNTNFQIRETLVYPSATYGSYAIDNFALNAAVAVPEPSAVALAALGIGLAAWGRRRRAGVA